MSEEEPKTDDANEQDGHGQISAVKKTVERDTVPIDDAFDEVTRPSFHSRLFVARSALTQNARAHQRGESERYQAGGKDCYDDGYRKLLKDPAEQARKKDQRNENRRQ